MAQNIFENFLWGTSTSAHQIEGGRNDDWTRWEKQNAERLSKKASERFNDLESWENIRKEAENSDNYISGDGSSHIMNFEEDIELMDDLGVNAYRFSLDWSWIQPEENKFNSNAINHYRELLDELERNNIEPIVSLWHFTNPEWFANKGGWHSDEAVEDYSSFVEKVSDEFEDVENWITLNEPTGWISHSHLIGKWPPEKKNPFLAYKAYKNMVESHKQAYDIIEGADNVGIAANVTAWDFPDIIKPVAELCRKAEYSHFLDRCSKKLDFIGVNYYQHRQILSDEEDKPVSDMGWELSPEGFYKALKTVDQKFDKPILVTEHGLADQNDENRSEYIQESLEKLMEAKDEGVNVEGYLHWSLTDNFEWDKGYWPKFGLIEVDYDSEDKDRKLRQSARDYRQLIQKYSDE
jgi:beta-glucosidase